MTCPTGLMEAIKSVWAGIDFDPLDTPPLAYFRIDNEKITDEDIPYCAVFKLEETGREWASGGALVRIILYMSVYGNDELDFEVLHTKIIEGLTLNKLKDEIDMTIFRPLANKILLDDEVAVGHDVGVLDLSFEILMRG